MKFSGSRAALRQKDAALRQQDAASSSRRRLSGSKTAALQQRKQPPEKRRIMRTPWAASGTRNVRSQLQTVLEPGWRALNSSKGQEFSSRSQSAGRLFALPPHQETGKRPARPTSTGAAEEDRGSNRNILHPIVITYRDLVASSALIGVGSSLPTGMSHPATPR
jgi:hypothetical protein